MGSLGRTGNLGSNARDRDIKSFMRPVCVEGNENKKEDKDKDESGGTPSLTLRRG